MIKINNKTRCDGRYLQFQATWVTEAKRPHVPSQPQQFRETQKKLGMDFSDKNNPDFNLNNNKNNSIKINIGLSNFTYTSNMCNEKIL